MVDSVDTAGKEEYYCVQGFYLFILLYSCAKYEKHRQAFERTKQ